MRYLGPSYHLLAKPSGADCNLDCQYCFFLSKEHLYQERRPRMSWEVLEAYIRQRLDSFEPEIEIAWQGGEPTLMGLDFFREAVALVERYRHPGQRVWHSLQTNGVQLDEEWCRFFLAHGFLVGLSVDGPPALHDAYRLDKRGQGTAALVRRAWDLLRAHGVETNVLCSIHPRNSHAPLEVYRYLRDELGATHLQFIPIVERATSETLIRLEGQMQGRPLYRQQGGLVSSRSVQPEAFGAFLVQVFDEWLTHDVGRVFISTFDAALGNWMGMPSLCVFSPYCGRSLALEHNGDVYACDHYVEPGFRLGNVREDRLEDLLNSPSQQAFGQLKFDSLPQCCRDCEVLFACYGECPRNRFAFSPAGEPGLNYLCAGYRQFFQHIDAPMNRMVSLLNEGASPANIMDCAISGL